MTRTSTKITFGLFAMKLRDYATLAMPDLQPFANLENLKTGIITKTPIATYENNFWLLNGAYKFLPTDLTTVRIGIMSTEMSDANGDFAAPPTLTITFAEAYSVNGLTLTFWSEPLNYASDIDVAYYDEFDALIQTDNHAPTGYSFSTLTPAADFVKIIITFNATSEPYRYLRLVNVDYGDLVTFEGAEIKSATVTEEMNPISTEIPISVLELSLFSGNEQFDVTNPAGDYFDLQNRQPLDVYETIDGADVYIGRFFLDTWENKSDKEIAFRAFDMLGVLDTYTTFGGIYSAITAGDLIAELMNAKSILYEIDAALTTIPISGWIPVCTYREALQQIAFAIGASVSCARNNAVQIRTAIIASALSAYDETISKADKGLQQTLTLKPLVTGVEILSHDYAESIDEIELYKGTLPTGSATVTFNEPAYDLIVTGAAITSSGANYAVLNVTVAGVVTLSGKKYVDANQVTEILNPTIDPYIRTNVLSIANATLVHAGNAEQVAQRVYDYYQMRYWQKTKLFAPTAQTGDAVLIDTLKNKQIAGVVERMTLNLSGGFTAQAEIIGVIAA